MKTKRKWTPEQREKFLKSMAKRRHLKHAKVAREPAPSKKSDPRAAILFLRRAIRADKVDPLNMTLHQVNIQLALMALEGRLA